MKAHVPIAALAGSACRGERFASMRRQWLASLIAGAAFLTAACSARHEEATWIETSLQAPDLLQPPVRLRIPRGYMNDLVGWWEPRMPQPARVPLDQTQRMLTLWATWPDMQPKSPRNAAQFHDTNQLSLHISVDAIPRHLGTRDSRITDPRDYMKIRRGWQEEFAKAYLEVDLVERTPRYGLGVRVVPMSSWDATHPDGRPRGFQEVMVPLGDAEDRPTTVISCPYERVPEPERRAPGVYTPHCEQYFPMPELDAEVKVHYRRTQLPRWREIQQRTEALLRTFIVQPNQ